MAPSMQQQTEGTKQGAGQTSMEMENFFPELSINSINTFSISKPAQNPLL